MTMIHLIQELSKGVEEKAIAVFRIFDTDASKEIDKNEALNHWKSKFGKLSAQEFFNQVDVNGDGQVTEEEFLNFWRQAKASGISEEEILEELENIEKGETWAGFSGVGAKAGITDMKHM